MNEEEEEEKFIDKSRAPLSARVDLVCVVAVAEVLRLCNVQFRQLRAPTSWPAARPAAAAPRARHNRSNWSAARASTRANWGQLSALVAAAAAARKQLAGLESFRLAAGFGRASEHVGLRINYSAPVGRSAGRPASGAA